MAIQFLKLTRQNEWKTWVARVPNIGALGGGMVVLTSEESVKHVLKTNFDNYIKGNEFQAWLSEFLGNGVFASDGAIWKHHRKVASHMFSARLLRHTLAVGYDVGISMINRIKNKIAANKNVIDIQDIFFRFTIDIFTLVAFGVHLHSFEREDQHPFAKSFDAIQAAIIQRVPNPLWRLSRCLGTTKTEKTIKNCSNVINNFAMNVISQKRRTADDKNDKNSKNANINNDSSLGPDLISRFLEKSKKDNTTMTNDELRDIVLNFMIAGRDTTACALTWCMYELSLHPEHADLIRQETKDNKILSSSSKNQDPHDETVAKERYAALNQMKYTEAYIYEVLRLHPSVPIDIKYSINKDVLPDGTIIPPGVLVCYSPYVLGRNPKVWSNLKYPIDAFHPNRWMEKETKPNTYAYPQFNAGPRLCLGKGLAMLEIKLGMAMLLNEFEVPIPKWKGADNGIVPKYQMTLTHPVNGGLKVEMKLRKK